MKKEISCNLILIWMFIWRQVYYGIIKQNWGYLDSSNGWEFNLVYLSFFLASLRMGLVIISISIEILGRRQISGKLLICGKVCCLLPMLPLCLIQYPVRHTEGGSEECAVLLSCCNCVFRSSVRETEGRL